MTDDNAEGEDVTVDNADDDVMVDNPDGEDDAMTS